MTKITQLTDKAIAVEVSPIAFSFRIGKSEKLKGKLFASCPVTSGFSYDLPQGSWSILGKGSELTASDKSNIVEKDNDGSGHLRSWWYKEYITDSWVKDIHVSFATLLESKSVNPDTTLILIDNSKTK